MTNRLLIFSPLRTFNLEMRLLCGKKRGGTNWKTRESSWPIIHILQLRGITRLPPQLRPLVTPLSTHDLKSNSLGAVTVL